VKVKILEADEKGRLRLSMKALLDAPVAAAAASEATPEASDEQAS
jgi:polyribonucleotide nucleotidyltransferase